MFHHVQLVQVLFAFVLSVYLYAKIQNNLSLFVEIQLIKKIIKLCWPREFCPITRNTLKKVIHDSRNFVLGIFLPKSIKTNN